MEQIKNDVLCKYCLGCNRLSDYNFIGTRNCKDFIPAYKNWREMYDRALKESLNI